MIHMEIAYRLLQQFPEIKNKSEFILGSVAPDSVHMNQHYEVEMKVNSHMFEFCGKWGNTQDYMRWEKNIKNFFLKNAVGNERTKYQDFSFGICVHCLTDYWNDIKIWKRLQKKYVPPMDFEKFKHDYYIEARGIDLWLYQNGKNTSAIRHMLSQAEAIGIDGIITSKEVELQRNHLLTVQYTQQNIDLSNYIFLSADTLEEFISFTTATIKKTLRLQ